jgi:hypothetical protein
MSGQENIRMDIDKPSLRPGDNVVIRVTNIGGSPLTLYDHGSADLQITNANTGKPVPVMRDNEIADLAPGKSIVVSIPISEPGRYVTTCHSKARVEFDVPSG